MAEYADTIAKYMGFDKDRQDDVYDASLLHDIGKREIARELLHKAARFTESEYKQIKQHVEKGRDVILPVRGPLERITPIILAHHDKFDGSGYHRTQGEEIPLEARIISVADVYDAMTSDRPYRKAMSPLDAKETIAKGSGTDFDPTVVKAFLKAFQSGALESISQPWECAGTDFPETVSTRSWSPDRASRATCSLPRRGMVAADAAPTAKSLVWRNRLRRRHMQRPWRRILGQGHRRRISAIVQNRSRPG